MTDRRTISPHSSPRGTRRNLTTQSAGQQAQPVNVEDFDPIDGLMPASLRHVFIKVRPEPDTPPDTVQRREPPMILQGVAALALLAIPLLLSSCTAPASENPEREAAARDPYEYPVTPWRDPQTGCEYLVAKTVRGGAAITPRMTAEGVHACYPVTS